MADTRRHSPWTESTEAEELHQPFLECMQRVYATGEDPTTREDWRPMVLDMLNALLVAVERLQLRVHDLEARLEETSKHD